MKSFAAIVLFLLILGLILGISAPVQAQYSGSCPTCIAVVGVSNVTGQTASQTMVNLVTTSATSGAGSYMIRWYADTSTPCSTGPASGGVTFTFSWTDASAARNFVTPSLNAATSNGPGSWTSGVIPLYAAASTTISYISTYTSACGIGSPPVAYDVHVSVERTQ